MCLPGRSRVKVVAEGCSVFPTRTDRRSPLFRKELILVHKKCPARGASPCERARAGERVQAADSKPIPAPKLV